MAHPEHVPAGPADLLDGLTADFAQMSQILLGNHGPGDALADVVDMAVATVEGCDVAGVFLVEGAAVRTPVHSDALVLGVDDLQRRVAEGPCLGAIAAGVPVHAADLDDDPRWPVFGPRATAMGVRSALAVPLVAGAAPGALNLYASYPAAFGVVDRARAQLLAGLASISVAVARSEEDARRHASNLLDALASREIIGQAQGILMERERITSEQAFDVLRRASQHLNIKLREVAQTLVETGERPPTRPADPTSAHAGSGPAERHPPARQREGGTRGQHGGVDERGLGRDARPEQSGDAAGEEAAEPLHGAEQPEG